MASPLDFLKDVFTINGKGSRPAAAPKANVARTEARVRPPRARNTNVELRIETIYITSYKQANEIADVLRSDVTVIINVSQLSMADRSRLIDFMAGLRAGLLAESKRVSEDVYLLAPNGMEIEADAETEIDDDGDRLIVRP